MMEIFNSKALRQAEERIEQLEARIVALEAGLLKHEELLKVHTEVDVRVADHETRLNALARRIRVRALRAGQVGPRVVDAGEEFWIDAVMFSARWMERIEVETES